MPFIRGHKPTAETRRKISESNRGKKRSEETKKKLSEARKGKNNPAKRLDVRKKIRERATGRKHSKETKQKMSEMRRGKNNCFYGKKHTDETIRKMSEIKKGKNNFHWLGGKSFEPYGVEFNKELRKQIRQRDNFICQECEYTEKQLGYRLGIHHIDYDKQNNNSDNLIALCKSCHAQTNFKRKNWTKYFMQKQGGVL